MRFETTADSCHFTNHCCSIAFKFAIARSMQMLGWAAPCRTKHCDRSLQEEKCNISWFHKNWLVKVHSSFFRLPAVQSISTNLTNKQKTRDWNFILGWVEGGKGRKKEKWIYKKKEREMGHNKESWDGKFRLPSMPCRTSSKEEWHNKF